MWLSQASEPAEIFAWSMLDFTDFLLDIFGTKLPERSLVIYVATFLLRGSLPGKTSIVCARIASAQRAQGPAGTLLTIRSTIKALEREECQQRMLEHTSRNKRVECERMVRQWMEGHITMLFTTKLSHLEEMLGTLGNAHEPVPYDLFRGMTTIVESARAQLHAAKKFAARIKVATENLDGETRARHIRILNTNGYRVLAEAVKQIHQPPRAIVQHPLKRCRSSVEVKEKRMATVPKKRKVDLGP
jgi:hypothetical protein